MLLFILQTLVWKKSIKPILAQLCCELPVEWKMSLFYIIPIVFLQNLALRMR